MLLKKNSEITKNSLSNFLSPSLLDKLTDTNPDEKRDLMGSKGLSKRDYRASVLRDIGWLLNTTNVSSEINLDELPMVRKSVFNYGVKALSGKYLMDDDRTEIANSLSQTLLSYEPRIVATSLQVKALPLEENHAARNQLSLEIKGQLWADPYPLEFLWRSYIDLEICQVQLIDLQDGTA